MFKKVVKKSARGFTLAELLIVVAIIAVLAVISVPLFRNKLEAAREQTDISNLRSAKSAAITQLLSNEKLDHTSFDESDYVVYYDAVQGCLTDTMLTKGYGKGTLIGGNCEAFNLIINPDEDEDVLQYTSGDDVEDCYIKITLNISGRIEMEWVAVTKA